MANCGLDEMRFLKGACDEELKHLRKVLTEIFDIEGITDAIFYDYLADIELELLREISERYCMMAIP